MGKGHRQRPAERAVSGLSAAFPEASGVELRRLTLGQCNGRLWEVRNRIFGSAVNGFSECATCGERLEFALDTEYLRAVGPASGTEFVIETMVTSFVFDSSTAIFVGNYASNDIRLFSAVKARGKVANLIINIVDI